MQSHGARILPSTHIYIYIYICVHTYMYIHIHTCINIYIYIHTYMYKRIHIHIYIYIYTHTYIYIYIHIHTHIQIDTHIYTHIHICIYMYIYTHTYTQRYICMYVHIYTLYTYINIHYLCAICIYIYTCRQAQSLETTKKWLWKLCKFAGMEAFGKMPLTLLRPLRNWKGAKLGYIFTTCPGHGIYRNRSSYWRLQQGSMEKNLLLLVFFGVMFSSLFDSILLRLAFGSSLCEGHGCLPRCKWGEVFGSQHYQKHVFLCKLPCSSLALDAVTSFQVSTDSRNTGWLVWCHGRQSCISWLWDWDLNGEKSLPG